VERGQNPVYCLCESQPVLVAIAQQTAAVCGEKDRRGEGAIDSGHLFGGGEGLFHHRRKLFTAG